MENAQASKRRALHLGVTLCRYILALDRGDSDLIQAIFQEAEQDEVVERMITEIHHTFRTEEDEAASAQGVAFMRTLLEQYRMNIWP